MFFTHIAHRHVRWILISLVAKNTTSIACPISEHYCRLAPFAILHLRTWHPNWERGREKERERERERERECKKDQLWYVLCTAPLLYYVNGIVIHTGWHVTQSSKTCRHATIRVVNETCVTIKVSQNTLSIIHVKLIAIILWWWYI